MKPATVKTAAESPVRVEFQVQFSRGPKGRRKVRAAVENAPIQKAEPTPVAVPAPPTTPHVAPEPPAVAVPTTPTEPPAPAPRVPKVTLLLVLGHYFERLVRKGAVKDYAEIARGTGLSRARISQIVDLTLLAPEIQYKVAFLQEGRECPTFTESALRGLVRQSHWERQLSRWRQPGVSNRWSSSRRQSCGSPIMT